MSDNKILSFKGNKIRLTLHIIIIIVILIVATWVRSYYGAMKTYQKGEAFLLRNQTLKAITFFDRSIHWYTPFNPYVQKSAEHLWGVGRDAEKRGDNYLALIAFRTIRRGFYASRSFYQPGTDWIKRCDDRINILLASARSEKMINEKIQPGGGYIQKEHIDTSPGIFWTIILEIGFLGWIGSGIGFIIFKFKKKKEEDPVISPVIYAWLTLFFFALWIVGMMKA